MEITIERKTEEHDNLNEDGLRVVYQATFHWENNEEQDLDFARRCAMKAIGDQVVEDGCAYIMDRFAPNHVQDGMGIFYNTSVPPDMVIAGKNAIEILLSKLLPLIMEE